MKQQSKTFYLVLVLIIIVVVIIMVQVLTSPSPGRSPTPQKWNGTGQESPPIIQPSKLKISSTNISENPINPTDLIRIRFDRAVDNETLALEITPQVDFIPLFDPSIKELILRPKNTWQFNTTYTVKVLSSTKSKDGQALDKDYQFTFKTKPYSGI